MASVMSELVAAELIEAWNRGPREFTRALNAAMEEVAAAVRADALKTAAVLSAPPRCLSCNRQMHTYCSVCESRKR